MASSSGSASVAPTPRRNVRRGSDVFDDDHGMTSRSRPSPLATARAPSERRALDDAEDDRRPRVVVLAPPRGRCCAPPAVVVFHAAAERVRQQLLGDVRDELLAVREQQRRAGRRARRTACRRRASPTRSIGAPSSSTSATGRRRRSSRARSRADPSSRGSSRTTGFLRCCSSRSRTERGSPSRRSSFERRHVRAAVAAAACRECSRAATCRAAPARCGSGTT